MRVKHLHVLVRSEIVVKVSNATMNDVGVEVTVVNAGSGVDVAVSMMSG